MTNFLPAGMINETLEEICQQIAALKQAIRDGDQETVLKGLDEVENVALDLWVFIEKFSCQPLIYTGKGTTDEIISRLEWALAFTEEIDPLVFMNKIRGERKKNSK